ncbi:MAG: hypothetical protein K6U75_02955 [Firmicutes bacterium]|nr:hypothetical protein [Bacillota bacterium]
MPFQVRFTVPDDLPVCVALCQAAQLETPGMQQYLSQIWQQWLQQGRAISAVVVDEQDHVVAFGLSAAVSEGFVQHVRNDRGTIVRAVFRYPDTAFYPSEFIRAHRGHGVGLIAFYGWREDLSESQLEQLHRPLIASFLHLHQGLHLRSITKEVYGEQALQVHLRMGFRLFHQTQAVSLRTQRREGYLIGVDRHDTPAQPGTFLHHLFSHTAPALQLRREQMEMLQLALLMAMSDGQIHEVIKVRYIETVWLRWHRVYDAFDRAGIAWRHGGRNHRRSDLLETVRRQPNLVFPLVIGKRFFSHPELARKYPIPCC